MCLPCPYTSVHKILPPCNLNEYGILLSAPPHVYTHLRGKPLGSHLLWPNVSDSNIRVNYQLREAKLCLTQQSPGHQKANSSWSHLLLASPLPLLTPPPQLRPHPKLGPLCVCLGLSFEIPHPSSSECPLLPPGSSHSLLPSTALPPPALGSSIRGSGQVFPQLVVPLQSLLFLPALSSWESQRLYNVSCKRFSMSCAIVWYKFY